MPFDGSGIFNRVRNWQNDAAAGIKIKSDLHDSEDNNLASGLSNVICKDGQTAVTADIPFNGKKLTNVANPTGPQDAATKAYADSIKSFSTGITITGSGAVNGSITHSGTTGPWGNAFTAADLYFGVRAIGDPAIETLNARFVWNDKADATGTDMMDLNDAINPVLRLRSLDPSATAGPILRLYRNSASPAAADQLGQIEFYGKDSSAADTLYGTMRGWIDDPTNNSEDGSIYFHTLKAGALTSTLALNGTSCSFGAPLTVAGNFIATGQIQSNNYIVSQMAGAAGVAVYNTTTGNAFGMYSAGNNMLYFSPATAAGNPTGSGMLQVDSGSNAYAVSFNASGRMFAGSGFMDTNSVFGFYPAPPWRIYQFAAGYDLRCDVSSTFDIHMFRNSASWTQWRVSDGALWHKYALTYKPGGGSWTDSSDERIKTVHGDYTNGLDAIKSLRPVHYSYLGNDTDEPPTAATEGQGEVGFVPPNPALASSEEEEPSPFVEPTVPYGNSPHYNSVMAGDQFIGLIAQEAEVLMPEIVTKRAGYIDGVQVTDLRDLNTGPLIFALINAVKELAAKVEALEAAA